MFLLLFFSILITSFVNFGFEIQLVGLYLCLGVLLVKSRKSGIKINRSTTLIFLVFLSYNFILYLVQIFFFKNISVESLKSSYNLLISLLSLSFSIILLIRLLKNDDLKIFFFKAVELVIWFHVLFFFIQFIVVYVTGYYIDAVYYFSGQESRYLSYVKVGLIGMYRPTGFLVEPSTYFGVVFCLYMGLKSSKYKLSKKIEVLTLISFILTFSSVAYVVLALYLILRFNNLGLVNNLLIFLFLSVMFAIFHEDIAPHFDKIVNSSQIRFALIDYLLNRDTELFVFGPSMFGIEQRLYDLASGNISSANHYNRVASINDVGSLVFLVVKLGLIGGLIYIWLLVTSFKCKKVQYFIPVTMIKLSVMNPIFVLLLPLYFIEDKNS